MRNYFIAELIKLKRRKFFVFLLATSCLILIIIMQTVKMGSISFTTLFYNANLIILFIHTIMAAIVSVMIFCKDYETGMMRQMLIVPVSMIKVFTAKIFLVMLISIFMSLVASLQIIIVSLAKQLPDTTISAMTTIFMLYVIFSVIIICGILPIISIAIACKQNTIIPTLSTFLYVGIMLVPSMGGGQKNNFMDMVFTYFYPMSSAFSIFNELMDKAGMGRIILKEVDILGSIVSLIAFSSLFIFLSIKLLKRKEK